MSFECISIKEAKYLIENNDLILIDIRDYHSFSKGHIDKAIHIEDLNIDNFVNAIIKAKPSGAKGNYFKDMYISSTMGPSLKLLSKIQ